jgi:hypothetical protein
MNGAATGGRRRTEERGGRLAAPLHVLADVPTPDSSALDFPTLDLPTRGYWPFMPTTTFTVRSMIFRSNSTEQCFT